MARFKTSFSDGFTDRDTSKIAARNLAAQLDNLAGNAAITKDGKTDRAFAQQLRMVLQDAFPRKKYTAKESDTPETIAAAAGITLDILYYLNPQLAENGIATGDEISLPYTSPIGSLDGDESTMLGDRFNSVFASNTKTTEEISTANQNAAATNGQQNNTGNTNEQVVIPQGNLSSEKETENNNAATSTGNTAVVPATTTAVVPEQTVTQPQLPADRSDIKIWTALNGTQQTTYHWSEVLLQFKAAQPKVGSSELGAWTRKQLRDGWNFGDEIPLLYKARQVASLGGIPVIEAYNADDAWIYARNMGLPKNADAPFYWQTKFGGTRQKFFLNYASASQYNNLKYNRDHKAEVDFDLLCEVAGNTGEDKALVKNITALKAFNDQLLSQDFLILTSHAQRVIYKDDPKLETKADGVHTPALYTLAKQWKQKKIAVEKKAAADKKAMHDWGLTEGADPGFAYYMRDGVKFQVNQQKLYNLRDKIADKKAGTISTETLENYITDNFSAATPGHTDERYFKLLYSEQRRIILNAYLDEWWLNDKQERLVNMIIRVTPIEDNQRLLLDGWLHQRKNEKYSELKDMVNDSKENKRSFFTATEEASITYAGAKAKVDMANVNSTVKLASGSTYSKAEAIQKLSEMSDRQIEVLTETQLAAIINGGIATQSTYNEGEDHSRAAGAEGLKELPHVLGVWFGANPKHNGQFLINNGFRMLKSLHSCLGDSFATLRDDTLDGLFTGNINALAGFRAEIKKPSDAFEDMMDLMPAGLIRDLTVGEQIEVIYQLMTNYGGVYGQSEEIIIRILENAGKLNPTEAKRAQSEEEIARNRQAFYDKLIGKGYKQLTKDAFYDAFQGYNETRAISQLNDMNAASYAAQKKAVVNAGYYDKDTAINEMSPTLIAKLSLAERKAYIKILLGKTKEEEAFAAKITTFAFYSGSPGLLTFVPSNMTRVGTSDEESLLLIIKTCKPGDYDKLMIFIKEKSGNIYNALHAAIDGEQFKRLHDEVANITEYQIMGEQFQRDASGKILTDDRGFPLETEKYKTERAKKENLQQQMELQGLAHPKVVPWADPGLLKQLFTGAEVTEYSVTLTPAGKVKVSYYVDNIWTQSNIGTHALTMLQAKKPKEYEAGERIGVLFLRDDDELNAREGEVRMMPAINLFYLENKQTQRQIGEAIDVAVIALGVWQLRAATTFFEIAMAVADIATSLINLSVNSFKENLPADVREALESLNQAMMVLQLGAGAATAANAVRKATLKLTNLMKNARLGKDAVIRLQGEIARAEGEARLFELLEISSKDELLRFEKDLQRMGGQLDPKTKKALQLRLKEQLARATGDERLVAIAKQEREALAAKNAEKGLTVVDKTDDAGKAVQHAGDASAVTHEIHISHNQYGGVQVKIITPEGKTFHLKVDVENGKMKFAPATKADADGLKYVDENLEWKTYDNMQPREKALVKNKPVNPKVKVVEPEAPKIQSHEDVIKQLATKTEVTPEEVETLLTGLNRDHNVVTSTSKETDDLLDAAGANALYWPGGGGKPGIMLIRTGAKPEELIEEMMHLMQHEKTGWKRLSVADILRLEVQAHNDLLRYAEENNWSAEQKAKLKQNRDYWEAQQKGYANDPAVKEILDEEVGAMTAKKAPKRFVSDPFDANGNLKPNVRYESGEYNYIGETDEYGRLSKMKANKLKSTKRKKRLDHETNTPGKKKGDHAGHIVGDRFGGSPELDNLVSQLSSVNLSSYKKIENIWAKAIKAKKTVIIEVKINYIGLHKRPSSFEVSWSINGKEKFVKLVN